jgi:hypothetical protein
MAYSQSVCCLDLKKGNGDGDGEVWYEAGIVMLRSCAVPGQFPLLSVLHHAFSESCTL